MWQQVGGRPFLSQPGDAPEEIQKPGANDFPRTGLTRTEPCTCGMKWNTDSEPGLIPQSQWLTSLMLLCLNGRNSLQLLLLEQITLWYLILSRCSVTYEYFYCHFYFYVVELYVPTTNIKFCKHRANWAWKWSVFNNIHKPVRPVICPLSCSLLMTGFKASFIPTNGTPWNKELCLSKHDVIAPTHPASTDTQVLLEPLSLTDLRDCLAPNTVFVSEMAAISVWS